MKNILIDIGNSAIKIGIGNLKNQSVKLLKRFPYSKSNFEKDFIKNCENIFVLSSVNKVGISILKGGNKKFIKNYFEKNLNTTPVFVNRNLKLPIKINYSLGLGNDRICNAVASNRIFLKKNILVIDFGTATTFTLISNNVLRGGMISPGIKTSLNSLIGKTSLPKINLGFPKKLINNNTPDNIKAGVLYQSLFSVERIIYELIKKNKGLFVVTTGGFANLISRKTKLINKIDENLVLKGINIIISK
jgi:type III pantothenate kinase